MAYSHEKIAAVVADLLMGMSREDAAQKHGVHRNTVQKWSKSVTVKKEFREVNIGDLVVELLENEIRTLNALGTFAREDKAWVAKQSANDIAVLYGVIADKTHAKLAALERAQREHQRAIDAAQEREE